MEELEIQTHDFEESKKQLKKFSEETTTDLELRRVNSGKGVGEFFGDLILGRGFNINHTVTGDELNSLTNDIQKHLIDFNDMQRSFINEFGHVYSALESLDKDYIQAILIAVKSAQKANGEAKLAQDDIEKTIEEQKKIIKVLQQFKEKMDKFKHVVDVDKMWSDLQKQTDNIARIELQLGLQSESIMELISVKETIDAIEHIYDIDSMYGEIQRLKEIIVNLNETNEFLAEQNNNLTNHIEEVERGFAKKIVIAYTLAGCSIGFGVIECVLALIGLI